MIDDFCRVRQVDESHNFNHRRRLVGKSREQFREPATEPFLQQQPFAPDNCRRLEASLATARDWETNVEKVWRNPPKS